MSVKRYNKIMEKKEFFGKIILKWLNIRDKEKLKFWYEPSDEYKHLPRYVMEMIKEINDNMPKPMLDKVKSLEQYASGHIDYHSKFSLYCAELYYDNLNK
ncbi:MAG: hypothetical protein ACOCVF_04000 [bacterium]